MMKIIKKEVNNKLIIVLRNEENGDEITLGYGGADFYFAMYNYHDDNRFIVTKDDRELYNEFENLFDKIKSVDNKYDSVLVNDKFIWLSDATGLKEDAHRIEIEKVNDEFNIKFYLNKNNRMCNKNICLVSFCLSGSINDRLTYEIVMFYRRLLNIENEKELIKKR